MAKIIHLLPHNIEDFIFSDYYNFDHHSIRFLEKIEKFAKEKNLCFEQELWVLTKKKKNFFEVLHNKGFKVKFFPISIKIPLPLEISFPLIKEVVKFKSLEKTVWHLHSYYLFMNDLIALFLFLKRKNFLIHYRGGGPSFTPRAFLYTIYHYLFGLRITLNLANFILVQNHDEEKRLINFLKIKKSKIVYFPNSIEKRLILQKTNINYKKKEIIKLIVAGRIEKFNKKKKIINVLKNILSKNKNCYLEIVGLKDKDEFLVKLKNEFSNQVILTPWLTKEQLLNKFQTGDIFLHLNKKNEGSPMTLIEAQSQGLPVLAFDIEGVRDIIKSNFNGFLVKNEAELEKKINEIIKNPSQLSKMRINSLKTIKKNFVDEMYFPKLINIYYSLLK